MEKEDEQTDDKMHDNGCSTELAVDEQGDDNG